VTANRTGLLSFIAGATDTATYPELAPVGIVAVIAVALQEFTVSNAPFNVTRLLPCVEPKFDPSISNWLPTLPVVAERLEMTGAKLVDELTERLSNVAE
jgi:hypothetical protein